MKVLVIIVTFNGMKWVDRCLGSVMSSTIPTDAMVIDNGSSDGTQEYIRSHYSSVIFKLSEKNLGFGKANNIGLQYALDKEYDYVYLLNQDAWIMPETIGELIKISEKHPEYGILSAFQMSSNLKTIDNYFVRDVCSSSISLILSDFISTHVRDVYSVSYVMAAHWFMPCSVVKEIGGFSPTFKHYGEDCNYADRVLYRGYKIGIVPSLKVVHDRGDRVETREKNIYIGYTGSLKLLSDPFINNNVSRKSVYKLTARNIIKYRSLKPFMFLIKIFSSIRMIRKNKEVSKEQKGAFLKIN